MDRNVDRAELREYKYLDGQWTFKDSEMLDFYRHMDLRSDTFYNVADLDAWNPIPYFRRSRFFMGYYDGVRRGAFWITSWNPLNKSGFFNFSWEERGDTDLSTKIRLCVIGLRLLLNMPDFGVLYAETSVSAIATLKFADYLGFVKIGKIPHAHWNAKQQKFEDTIFMYITKDTLR